ncbi:hypothetical protein CHO01_35770 [Cellulomonas hominis]|uniref:Glycosyltransferase involved in cell wall biosynthesis n=1 Tax=Cellulomonas hominis TaxID=156981 RepID=A0A511FGY4_9CELL|nr:glycosyltransferase [Cellulomonas hominis]MBB5474806.1 glycosyltransferase involved in cell wall biosynthesis [Cellulomonas hominis]NKY05676.1 glycosyltransferase [Cellulomonas hominis]GEL48461.1 hypothetical protein CHO01_35770 [Cellulomonas hominis]
MPTMRLDVSVVIAARDAAATLPAQLRALARQDFAGDWEVLVADNGSRDATAQVVGQAPRRLPALRELRYVDASAQRGAGPARNAAASVARGDVLAFCDADDVVADDWLRTLLPAVHRTDALVGGRLEWQRLNAASTLSSRALPQTDGLQHSAPVWWLPSASSSNLAVPADAFLRVGGFDPVARYLEDTDLCWRAQLGGASLHYEHDAVVHMRLRETARGAFAQGRGNASGQRWLQSRYALVAAQHRPAGGADECSAAPRHAPASMAARRVRRVRAEAAAIARVRARGDVHALAWNWGFAYGYRLPTGPTPNPIDPRGGGRGRIVSGA